MNEVVTNIWDKARVQALIDGNDQAVIRALMVVYGNQTVYEQEVEGTLESNQKGFSGADAEILTSFAKQFQSKNYLSPKQVAFARKKVKKYWRQLLKVIEENGTAVSYK